MHPSLSWERLNLIQDWPERALQAGYRVDQLADLCGTSRHALRLFFRWRFTKSTKKLLSEWRVQEVKRRLQNKERRKDIARDLGYGNAANLIRNFKAACGMCPREWLENGG